MSTSQELDNLLREAARMHGSDHQFLELGKTYRVIKEFADYDKRIHPAGERWIYLGSNFVPYHDGLSWFVTFDGKREVQIRMQWIQEEQAPIIDALAKYIEEDR